MKTEILQTDTYTKIWYFNDGVYHTILIVNKDNKLIQIEVSERDENGKHIADHVYGADGVREIGRRLYDEHGWRDYRKMGDEWVLTQWTHNEWLIPEQKAKCSWFNGQNELVFYDVFEHDPECGMIFEERYTPNDEPFHFDAKVPRPEKIAILLAYTDY